MSFVREEFILLVSNSADILLLQHPAALRVDLIGEFKLKLFVGWGFRVCKTMIFSISPHEKDQGKHLCISVHSAVSRPDGVIPTSYGGLAWGVGGRRPVRMALR